MSAPNESERLPDPADGGAAMACETAGAELTVWTVTLPNGAAVSCTDISSYKRLAAYMYGEPPLCLRQ